MNGDKIPATTRNPYNGLFGFVSVAGRLTNYIRYVSVEKNNVYSLDIDVTNLGWGNCIPKKWELYGGQWNQKYICFATGVCRIYDGGLNNALLSSYSSITPSVSINENGVLHVEFGTQLSYAKLFVYY